MHQTKIGRRFKDSGGQGCSLLTGITFMLTSIKKYLYIGLGFVGLTLFGWIKLLSNKNDKLKQEVTEQTELKQISERNTLVVEKKHKDSVELNKALSDVKTESDKIEAENNENRIKKVRPNRGDVFGDSRLK
jgi:hypothetical protein